MSSVPASAGGVNPLDRILSRLPDAKRSGRQWTARCPAHADRTASLSVAEGDDGRVLVKCFAGCEVERIVAALGLEMRDLFPQASSNGRGGGGAIPSINAATLQHSPAGAGCTVANYAAAKRVPADFLRGLGLTDITYAKRPAVRIPYRGRDGAELAVRFRLALTKTEDGDERFRWKSGARPSLYGLWRVQEAEAKGYIVLVEGESDCHVLWYNGVPAIGVPGADSWLETWATELERVPTIYVVIEPDAGGEAVKRWLGKSRIRDRVRLVSLGQHKDPADLWVSDSTHFLDNWQADLDAAAPWQQIEAGELARERAAAWECCRELAGRPDILSDFAAALASLGVAGETRAAKLIFLALVSRLLARPVSVAVKGPSSGGKSYIVEKVLDFFPPAAYYALSGMSERALAYSDEPVAHRTLVIYEAAGLRGEFASYLVRSLLSEGRIRYEVVEKTAEGLRPRLIEREGPTGLVVTTTAVRLHPENETRLLSIPVTDTPEQTSRVLRALAEEDAAPADLAPWQALQTWLAGAENATTIPYAGVLAATIPPVAVRLRRDFGAILNLIRAHAVLHQTSRERDAKGRIVATLTDYERVRELVAELVAEGVEQTVSPEVRETVQAAVALAGTDTTSVTALARHLKLDKSAMSRRVAAAVEKGYLKNLEDKKGRPARLVLGEPLPEDRAILPECCSVAALIEGIEHPPSPSPTPDPSPTDDPDAFEEVDL